MKLVINMEEKKKLSHTIFSLVILILVPIFFSLLLRFCFIRFGDYEREIAINYGRGFGFCLGALYQLSCFIAGYLSDPFFVVFDRIKNFFGDLTISVRFAFKHYFSDLFEKGLSFWRYIMIKIDGIKLGLSDGFDELTKKGNKLTKGKKTGIIYMYAKN